MSNTQLDFYLSRVKQMKKILIPIVFCLGLFGCQSSIENPQEWRPHFSNINFIPEQNDQIAT